MLGTELFERSTRHVSLTSAGEALVIDARVALDAVSAAGRRAVRAGRAGSTLVVASKPDGDAGVLPELLGALQREAPGVEAELVFAATGDRAASMLRDGRADVALVPAPFDERGLDCDELLAEARVVALPATHPLAGHRTVALADALAEVAVSWPHADDALAAFYQGRDPDSLAPAAAPALPPGPRAADLAEALRLVELGRAVTFVPASVAARYPREGIAYRQAPGLSELRLRVAWAASSRSPLVAAFIRAAATVRSRVAADGAHRPGPAETGSAGSSKCGFSMTPMTLPDGSTTVATRMEPPTSRTGSRGAAPASMSHDHASSQSRTPQNVIGPRSSAPLGSRASS